MQLILENPYRVLGVLAGATTREISRQANTIRQFLTAEQELPCDYGFFVLDNLNRTIESVDVALAKLNLDADKVTAALFWFYKGNSTDELAFDALKTGDINLALQIWGEQLYTKTENDGNRYWQPVNDNNYSAFHNYFVASFLSNSNTKILNAIAAQLKFLESEYCSSFVVCVTDQTFKTSSKDLQLIFLNKILREIEQKTINIKFAKLVSILNNNNPIREDFLKIISQKLTEKINDEIEIARKNTKDRANVAETGENLYEQTKDDMEQMKIIFGVQDFICSAIADKLSNEIMQCGISYFEYFRDTDTDPGERSMKLFEMANSLAVGNLAKQSCQENITGIQHWINENNRNSNRKFTQWIRNSLFFNKQLNKIP